MFSQAFNFLLTTVLNLLTMMFILRFLMQLYKISFYNPLGQIVLTLTDFAVKPARRFIPSWKKIDLSTLFLAIFTQLILQIALLWLRNFPLSIAGGLIWPSVLFITLISVIRMFIDVFFYAILLQAILSWVNPHTPLAPVLNSLTSPLLRPIQKFVPVVNGIDFSPLVALILLQMINISMIGATENIMQSIF